MMSPKPGGTYATDLVFTSNDPITPRPVLHLTFVVVAPVATTRLSLGRLKALYRAPIPGGR